MQQIAIHEQIIYLVHQVRDDHPGMGMRISTTDCYLMVLVEMHLKNFVRCTIYMYGSLQYQ